MNRLDALKVWEDLTRELWPEADVEKSALRIEHQVHVDWLLNDAYDCGCSDSPSLHRPSCPAMKAWEALDMREGHAEVGRAFDEARPLFGVHAASYDLWQVLASPATLAERILQAQGLLDAGYITEEQAREILAPAEPG